MASHFQIQKPYVLTSLPRPLDPETGRYVVGEVYGSLPGSKKRKRSELTVGTDGDSVNIYDVSSARLVTSYPIPPQSSFTCPASSIRRRTQESKEIARYTYASTHDQSTHKITLFKDLVGASGETTSKTESVVLGTGQPVIYLAPIRPLVEQPGTTGDQVRDELVVVRADGDIIGLDAENLERSWVSTPSALYKSVVGNLPPEIGASTKENFKVEFCSSALVSDVVRGIFKGNDELVSFFPGERLGNKTDSEVLVLISSCGPSGQKIRNLHIVGVSPQNSSHIGQRVTLLYAGLLTARPSQSDSAPAYHLDVQSGTLLEFDGQTLTVFDLTTSMPRVSTMMALNGASSFLRLSKTSLLSSTATQLNVYNPLFRSLQSSTSIDLEGQPLAITNGGDAPSKCQLVAYFSRLELAIAIVNSSLVAIQLEAPKMRTKKRRAEGLLIDSIGRGVPPVKRSSTTCSKHSTSQSAFSNYLPGSVRGDYWQTWAAEESRADSLVNSNDIYGLETFLAQKFGIQIRENPKADGKNMAEEGPNSSKGFPSWKWPKTRADYAYVDRRWVLYAISRVFHWSDAISDDATTPRLICQLPQSNLVNYLVDAGHLTLSNLKSAFKLQFSELNTADSLVAEELITRLADLDPSLELLSVYVSATTLGSVELLLAVRTIMRSLELVQDRNQQPPKLLTSGSSEEADNGFIGMELDNLEEQIQKTESYLNGDGGVRGASLSVAFAKLGNCPSAPMIKALRSTLKPEEILSLVTVLRVELVKGAWTSRYLDNTDFEQDAELDAPPDGVIKLIADLLGRCVDAIGPNGWLMNDAILAGDELGDFITSLKLEISAALEGLQEAVYLRGVVGETVKYCQAAEKQAKAEKVVNKMKPIPLHVREPGVEALPLGLRVKGVSPQKVVSGGEIVERSKRETGHLKSQQVGSYSLERIAI